MNLLKVFFLLHILRLPNYTIYQSPIIKCKKIHTRTVCNLDAWNFVILCIFNFYKQDNIYIQCDAFQFWCVIDIYEILSLRLHNASDYFCNVSFGNMNLVTQKVDNSIYHTLYMVNVRRSDILNLNNLIVRSPLNLYY